MGFIPITETYAESKIGNFKIVSQTPESVILSIPIQNYANMNVYLNLDDGVLHLIASSKQSHSNDRYSSTSMLLFHKTCNIPNSIVASDIVAQYDGLQLLIVIPNITDTN